MNRSLFLILASLILCPFFSARLSAADSDEEQKLIAVLQSGASLTEKDAACARLKFIGTARSVAALAALLDDDQLSHSARYALEAMRFEEAGTALLQALDRTKGLVRVGLINSLGARQEMRAVPALVQILKSPDVELASASARALGQIGGSDSLKALRLAARNATPIVHHAAVDSLLFSANRLVESGQASVALAIFEQLGELEENETVRQAAFRGRVRASGKAGLQLVVHAISGPAGPDQSAALQLARELQVPDATDELCKLLPDLQEPVQSALIGALTQRGDTGALPAIVALATKADPQLRLAITGALDALGDASVVPLLASFAGLGASDLQRAARLGLADLHRGNVTQALIDLLSNPGPELQSEAARALAARGDKAAVPKLIEVVQRGPGTARKGALQALSVLVNDAQLGSLVDFVLVAKNPNARAESAEALNSAYQHLQSRIGHPDVQPLVGGIEKGSDEAKAALLPICGGLVDPKIHAAMRGALASNVPSIRAAAVRALSDSPDPACMEDLVALARATQDEGERTLAINGGVRLVTQEESVKLAPAERVAVLKSLLGCASATEQKRRVLAGLAEVPDLEALHVVEKSFHDSATRNEAARAAIKIAAGLPANAQSETEGALKQALAAADDAGTRQAVQVALGQLQQSSEYLTDWEVAGPYRQADKDYAALFDTAFEPEKNANTAKWIPLTSGADPKRAGVIDLLKALGGEQCVAYARTWVHCDRACNATLELGSDDGVKVWLNDKPVYALNVARPLQPASDKINVSLRPGWNPLMLKVTQNNLGWEFCVRVRNTDGSHLNGVRCDAAPKNIAAGQ